MIILGIETSCDETALSLIEVTEKNTALSESAPSDNTPNTPTTQPHFRVLGNTLVSQIKIHEQYGGVFPMVAKREHAKNLVPLLYKILDEAKLLHDRTTPQRPLADETGLRNILSKENDLFDLLVVFLETHERPRLDAIAVTSGPGLEPALWVGVSFAKALARHWNIPLVPVNHMEGHIVASLLERASADTELPLKPLAFPALALLVSGGHTELVHIEQWRSYKIIGKTVDDAVGEAFDKVARILGLSYPGGPEISRLAALDRAAHPEPLKEYLLPRPMLHSHNLNFSFSGLKTAVLYMVKKITGTGAGTDSSTRTNNDAHSTTISGTPLTPEVKQHIARAFEDSVVDVLTAKSRTAIEEHDTQSFIIGGGVIANTEIRRALGLVTTKAGIPLYLPETHLSTDNALMIALAGYFVWKSGSYAAPDSIRAEGNLSF